MRKLFYLLLGISISSAFVLCGDADKAKAASFTMADLKEDTIVKPTGMIAYTRNDAEIRLIDSAGRNDRQLWTHPDAKPPFGIFDLAWRPDGKELAFSSGHENMLSVYHADLYGIRPDGSGFRKITNAPDYKNLSKYKKGTVTITLKNFQYSFQKAQSSAGNFTVYLIGAEMPQQVLLPPGTTKTIVFKNVADFGDHAQAVVAIAGQIRWIMPGTDVVAGKTTKAPDFMISGDGYEYFGAFRPVWKSDGSQISYRDGMCLVKTVPVNPGIGVQYKPLFGAKGPSGSCFWDWGPTQALSNQVIYSQNESEDGSGFYIMKEGGVHSPSNRLMLYSKAQSRMVNDVHWLPDGSGFLYSHFTNYLDVYDDETRKIGSNIFKYDLRTKKTTQITNVKQGFAGRFTISPNGQWIVYERGQVTEGENEESLFELTDLSKIDLWIVKIDGSEDRLLVKNGSSPSWSQ